MGGIHGIPGGPRGGAHKILGEARGWHWIPGEIDEVPGGIHGIHGTWEDPMGLSSPWNLKNQ